MTDGRALNALYLAIPYAAISGVLTVSAALAGGAAVGTLLLIHLVTFSFVFIALNVALPASEARPIEWSSHRRLARWVLDAIAVAAPLLLIAYLAYRWRLPLVESLATDSFDRISLIREDLFGYFPIGDTAVRYVVHGILPIVVCHVYLTRRQLIWLPYLIVALTLSGLFMFKSFPLVAASALLYHLLLTRAWRSLALASAATAAVLLLQVYASNPHMRPGWRSEAAGLPAAAVSEDVARAAPSGKSDSIPWVMASALPTNLSGLHSNTALAASGLWERLLVRPGEGIATWLALIPSRIKFTYGCSIRRVARLRGCEYVDLPTRVYALSFPEFVQRGLRGSINVPHYIEDYAMIGRAGLVLAAVYVALGMVLAARLFPNVPISAFIPIVLLLFTSPLHVVVLSEGGIAAAVLIALLSVSTARVAGRYDDDEEADTERQRLLGSGA